MGYYNKKEDVDQSCFCSVFIDLTECITNKQKQVERKWEEAQKPTHQEHENDEQCKTNNKLSSQVKGE